MEKKKIDMPKAIIMVNMDEEDDSNFNSGMYVKWDFIRKLYTRYNKGNGSKAMALMYADISNAVITKCQRLLNQDHGEKVGAIEPKTDNFKKLRAELADWKDSYLNLESRYKNLQAENKKFEDGQVSFSILNTEVTLEDLQLFVKALEDLERLNYHLEIYFDTKVYQWIAGVIMVDGNGNSVLVDTIQNDFLSNLFRILFGMLEKKMDGVKVVDD